MLTDQDIQKLTSLLATKEDIGTLVPKCEFDELKSDILHRLKK